MASNTPHAQNAQISFCISATKCKIYELNAHLEKTIGYGDLPEHWVELRGAKAGDRVCMCHFLIGKNLSTLPKTWTLTDSAAALDETLQTGCSHLLVPIWEKFLVNSSGSV